MRTRAKLIAEKLAKEFPEVKTPLIHTKDYELLFAVIMSAQCTDERVNMVTAKLFKKYDSLKKFAQAKQLELEKDIGSVTYFKAKSKHIIEAANLLQTNFDNKVPDTMEELISLPGVGRKTANVILSELFGKNIGFVVDTHVKRVAYRTRLSDNTDPAKIEKDLMKLFPQNEWRKVSLRMIFHGRTTCKASRKSDTPCSLGELCDKL